jgi:hypothetical protein
MAAHAELERRWRRLRPLATPDTSLDLPPPRHSRFGSPLTLSRVHWVRPELVAEVKYLIWTEDNPFCARSSMKGCARTNRLRTSAVRYRTLSGDNEYARTIPTQCGASRSSAPDIRKRRASQLRQAAADRPYRALRRHRLSDRLDRAGRALSRPTAAGEPLMLIRLVEGYGIDTNWRPLDEISPNLIRAAMAGEDARFCRHHGFDWGAFATAWDRYQSGHGRLLGASTISMHSPHNFGIAGDIEAPTV